MADSGAATSQAEGTSNGNAGAAGKAREAASAPASRSICLRRVISRPAASVAGTAVQVAPAAPAASAVKAVTAVPAVPAVPAPAPAVPTKPQVPVTVVNRTIKLPVGPSSVKNDLMTSLLSELLDEANESDDDCDGDGATNDAAGGGAPLNRLKPNTNFLTRLVSSTERSNRRIIAEATGLPQAKRKAKAKGKQLISKSFSTRRRRGISLINSIATKYGIRLRVLPLDESVSTCDACGASLAVGGGSDVAAAVAAPASGMFAEGVLLPSASPIAQPHTAAAPAAPAAAPTTRANGSAPKPVSAPPPAAPAMSPASARRHNVSLLKACLSQLQARNGDAGGSDEAVAQPTPTEPVASAAGATARPPVATRKRKRAKAGAPGVAAKPAAAAAAPVKGAATSTGATPVAAAPAPVAARGAAAAARNGARGGRRGRARGGMGLFMNAMRGLVARPAPAAAGAAAPSARKRSRRGRA